MKSNLYDVTFKNGCKVIASAAVISSNRYFDGLDWFYFETTDPVPPMNRLEIYHKWELVDGTYLTGWLIPNYEVEKMITNPLEIN